MHLANLHPTGGFISGEIKLVITLRLLAGSTHLDLGLLHTWGYSSIYRIFYHSVDHWTYNDDVVVIDIYDQLKDVEGVKNTAKIFSKNGNNLSMFGGMLGVLDGCLVKIKCPTTKRDGVLNFGSFYCRRGHYAINVQAIVDRNKIVKWSSIKCRDSEHDSTAFKRSDLHQTLIEKHLFWFLWVCVFLGDYACALRPFLLTTYDNVKLRTQEDALNHHLSTKRICIECTFR